jgi:hypothetical protein
MYTSQEARRAAVNQAVAACRHRKKEDLARLRKDVNHYRSWFCMPLLAEPVKHTSRGRKRPSYFPPMEDQMKMTPPEIKAWKSKERLKRRNINQKHAAQERKKEKEYLEIEYRILHERFLKEQQELKDVVADIKDVVFDEPCQEESKVDAENKAYPYVEDADFKAQIESIVPSTKTGMQMAGQDSRCLSPEHGGFLNVYFKTDEDIDTMLFMEEHHGVLLALNRAYYFL